MRDRTQTLTDLELLVLSREGDSSAYAELWSRHHRAGLAAARAISPRLDAEDLVSEAYLKILDLVRRGKGPKGAFRPYLYQVIRSLSADWGKVPESSAEYLDELPPAAGREPWDEGSFDLATTSTAFNSLNERWQSVLWYTEVEGLRPRHAAKLLGTTPNGASALAKRARDALRAAWVEAHVNRQLAEAACQSVLEQLPRYRKGTASLRARREVDAHLAECPKCRNAAEGLTYISQRLALVLAWIFVGGGSAAALLSTFGTQTAQAAVLAAPTLAEGTVPGFATTTLGSHSAAGGVGAASSGATSAGVGAASAGAAAAGGAAVSASGIVLTAAAGVLALAVAGAAVVVSTAPQEEVTIASAPENDHSQVTPASSDAEPGTNGADSSDIADDAGTAVADDDNAAPVDESEEVPPPTQDHLRDGRTPRGASVGSVTAAA